MGAEGDKRKERARPAASHQPSPGDSTKMPIDGISSRTERPGSRSPASIHRQLVRGAGTEQPLPFSTCPRSHAGLGLLGYLLQIPSPRAGSPARCTGEKLWGKKRNKEKSLSTRCPGAPIPQGKPTAGIFHLPPNHARRSFTLLAPSAHPQHCLKNKDIRAQLQRPHPRLACATSHQKGRAEGAGWPPGAWALLPAHGIAPAPQGMGQGSSRRPLTSWGGRKDPADASSYANRAKARMQGDPWGLPGCFG